MIQSPCKNCTDRHLGCHGSCKKYNEYQKKNDEEKENIKRQKHALYSLPEKSYQKINLRGR